MEEKLGENEAKKIKAKHIIDEEKKFLDTILSQCTDENMVGEDIGKQKKMHSSPILSEEQPYLHYELPNGTHVYLKKENDTDSFEKMIIAPEKLEEDSKKRPILKKEGAYIVADKKKSEWKKNEGKKNLNIRYIINDGVDRGGLSTGYTIRFDEDMLDDDPRHWDMDFSMMLSYEPNCLRMLEGEHPTIIDFLKDEKWLGEKAQSLISGLNKIFEGIERQPYTDEEKISFGPKKDVNNVRDLTEILLAAHEQRKSNKPQIEVQSEQDKKSEENNSIKNEEKVQTEDKLSGSGKEAVEKIASRQRYNLLSRLSKFFVKDKSNEHGEQTVTETQETPEEH